MLKISLFLINGICPRVVYIYLRKLFIKQNIFFFIYLYCEKQEHFILTCLLIAYAGSPGNSVDYEHFHY